MKRLAIFIGGLLVLPAFAEVAPIFYEENDALEYADVMYDENGFLIIPNEEVADEAIEQVVEKTPVKISRQPVNSTPVANRSTATRAVPAASTASASGRGSAAGNSSRVVAARTTTNTNASRATANRAVSSRGAATTSPRGTAGTTTATRATASNSAATRAAATRATGGATRTTTNGATRAGTVAGRATSARTATTTSANVARASRPSVGIASTTNKVTVTSSGSSITTDDTVNNPLYNSTDTSRVSMRGTGSVRRMPTIRMATLNSISTDTSTSTAMTTEEMDDLAELTDYCKAQYSACMDNYCNVLDDNQGRCSCSANLKNYTKAEESLKQATEELQDVAQKIQYIGLTSREVETLFSQTEAELAMQSKNDNSQLKTSLDKVKNMIIDVKSGGATSTSSNLNFDLSGLLEFSFDSTGFDLASLFGSSSTGSVSNQRGEELYKTAAARCKTAVLKSCTDKGVDASLITNAYDLEIDRECVAYERSLNDSNDQMLATVRNAKSVLQKARLMVAQQKNTYDMRGCINALDSCMQDEFVCGSDYENCLDPTGRYIVNGEVVVGSQPGHAIDPEVSERIKNVMTSDVCRVNLYRTWDFPGETCLEHGTNYINYPTATQHNAWGSGDGDTLVEYINETVKAGAAKSASINMSEYLQNKIGYAEGGKNYGMCMSVLNKCQDYTYTGKGTNLSYNPTNDVIKQYLGRVLVQIKAKQDEILANYAETCVSDVTSCLGQNNYPAEDPSDWEPGLETTTNTTKANIAVNACRAQIVTCMSVNGYSIETPTPTEMNCWVQGLLYNYITPDCEAYSSPTVSCTYNTYQYCTTQQACEGVNRVWCNGQCQAKQCGGDTPTYSCSPTNLQYCTNKTDCQNVGQGYWCSYSNSIYNNTCISYSNQSLCTSTPSTTYSVNIDCNNGSFVGGKNPQTVLAGNSLTLTGLCSRTGYHIKNWTCGGSTISNNSYTPTTSSSTCKANWELDNSQTYSVTLKCNTGCDNLSAGYENQSFQLNANAPIPVCNGANQTQSWKCDNGSAVSSISNGARSIVVTGNISCAATCGNSIIGTEVSVKLDCGAGTVTGKGASSNTTLTTENGSISLTPGMCTQSGQTVIGWMCNGVEYSATDTYTPSGDGTGCQAIWSGAGSSPNWVTITFDYGSVSSPTTQASPSKLFVDANHVCSGVFGLQPSGSNCPSGGLTKLTTTPKATSTNSPAFKGFYIGSVKYIDEQGNFTTASGGRFTYQLEGLVSDRALLASWAAEETPTHSIVIDNGPNGMRSGANSGVSTLFVNTNCEGFYVTDPGSSCTGTPITNIGMVTNNTTRSSGFWITLNGQTVQFADEQGNILLSPRQFTGEAASLTATAQFFEYGATYIAFDTTTGTWATQTMTPSASDYDVYPEFDINFYPRNNSAGGIQNGTPTTVHYTRGSGYTINGRSASHISVASNTGYKLRGYYPAQFSWVSENGGDANKGKAWPSAWPTSTLSLNNSSWILAVRKGTNFNGLNLYAAWAKECPSSMTGGSCTMDTSDTTNGTVSYTGSCNTGYTQSGTGANIECKYTGSSSGFGSVDFDGAN